MLHLFTPELSKFAEHIINQCAKLASDNRLAVGYPNQGYAITNYYGIQPANRTTVQQVL